jgi:hypothetical protein
MVRWFTCSRLFVTVAIAVSCVAHEGCFSCPARTPTRAKNRKNAGDLHLAPAAELRLPEFASNFAGFGDSRSSQIHKLIDCLHHIQAGKGASDAVMIDVGMQVGQEARYAMDAGLVGRIFGFEIFDSMFERMASSFPFNELILDGKLHAFNEAVSNITGPIPFFRWVACLCLCM